MPIHPWWLWEVAGSSSVFPMPPEFPRRPDDRDDFHSRPDGTDDFHTRPDLDSEWHIRSVT